MQGDAVPMPTAPRGSGAAEVFVAIAAAGLAAVPVLAPSAWPLLPAALVGVTAWIVWRDVRDFVIPDGASAALAALALGARLAAEGPFWDVALLAIAEGLVCGAALFAVREVFYRLRGHDGLGFGDVKLAAGLGILVGLFGFALALLAASAAGIAVALMRGAERRAEKLPFGALLAPAALLVWALGLGAPGLL